MSLNQSKSIAFPSIFKACAEKGPNKLAFTFLDQKGELAEQFCYKALYDQSKLIAANLQGLSEVGDRVLLLLEHNVLFVQTFLACLLAGVIPVVIPNISDADILIRKVTAKAKIRFIVHDHFEQIRCPGVENISFLSLTTAVEIDCKEALVALDDVAFIQFSSGSTAMPKGIMITHRNIVENLHRLSSVYDEACFKVGCCWTPLQHDMGLVGGILLSLYVGASSVIMKPTLFLSNPLTWLKAISKYRATFTFSPNFAFEYCLSIPGDDLLGLNLSHWKLAVNGGERINKGTICQFIKKFEPFGLAEGVVSPGYGLSEATMTVTASEYMRPITWLSVSREDLKHGHIEICDEEGDHVVDLVACGKPLGGHELIIVDPNTFVRMPPCKIGEIWLSGPSVALGYCNEQEVSQEVFAASLPGSEVTYLRTGDLGFLDKNNNLYVTGRLKRTLIYRGRNYYLKDIERAILNGFPQFAKNSNAAFLIDESQGEIGIVQEIDDSVENFSILVQSIKKVLMENFSLKLAYASFVNKGKLPRTSLGKIKLNAVKQLFYIDRSDVLYAYNNKAGHGDRAVNNIISETAEAIEFLKAQGLLGALVPCQYGGRGLTFLEFLKKLADVAEHDLDKAAFFLNACGASLLPIILYGSNFIKQQLLPFIVRGDLLVSFAFTESNINSSSALMQTYFREAESGCYISGTKLWGGALWAKKAIVFARSDQKASLVAACVVDLESETVSRGEQYDLLGLGLLQQAPITFDKTFVSRDHILQEDGVKILDTVLDYTRLGVARLSLSAISKSAEIAVELMRDRQLVNGSLLDHPLIKQRLLAAKNYEKVLEESIYLLAFLLEKNIDFPREFLGLIKAQSSDWANSVVHDLFLSLGGAAYLVEYKYEKLYRTVLGFSIIEGANDALFSFVGRALLETDKFQSFFLEYDQEKIAEEYLRDRLDHIMQVFNNQFLEGNKQKRLYLHYYIGKTLSPVLLHLLLKLVPDSFDYSIDRNTINLANQLSLGLLDNAAVINAPSLADEEPLFFDAVSSVVKHSSNKTKMIDWVLAWCVKNLQCSESDILPDSNFFELGMDSLYAAIFIQAFNSKVGLNLEPSIVWKYSSADALVEVINNKNIL